MIVLQKNIVIKVSIAGWIFHCVTIKNYAEWYYTNRSVHTSFDYSTHFVVMLIYVFWREHDLAVNFFCTSYVSLSTSKNHQIYFLWWFIFHFSNFLFTNSYLAFRYYLDLSLLPIKKFWAATFIFFWFFRNEINIK